MRAAKLKVQHSALYEARIYVLKWLPVTLLHMQLRLQIAF